VRRKLIGLLGLSLACLCLLQASASAMWTASGSGSGQRGARTITNAAPISSACVANGGADDVKLTWSVSPDSAIVSYIIQRTGGAAAKTFAPSLAGTATTFTDTTTDWPAATAGFSYTYTIKAVVGTAPWTTSTAAFAVRNFTKNGKCS
jgi:hypothetical protein